MTSTSPNNCDLPQLLAFAGELADHAATVTLAHFKQPLAIDNKLDRGEFDPVTVADRNAESVMRTAIEQRYPAHGILGEEYGVRSGTEEYTWVLDPIDGTRAFISGIPVWGTLIALFDGIQPIVGVMDQPFTKERFVASELGASGQVNGRNFDLKTRTGIELANATMMSTAPEMFSESELNAQQSLAQQVKLTRYGADCYGYCMLACGHVDLVVEAGLSPYDIQALIPIVQNAGGIVTDWQGGSAAYGGQIIAAASESLHAKALSVLQPAAKKSLMTL